MTSKNLLDRVKKEKGFPPNNKHVLDHMNAETESLK